jgi:predicted O-methyltransferase YrrM
MVYAIDPHTGSEVHHQMYGEVDTFAEFKQNIQEAGVEYLVAPMRMTSKEAEVAWKADALPIALLFIDGDHEDTEADFLRWEPYVAPGGVIAIHDTTTWPSRVPYRAAVKYLYKSDTFRSVSRVGSITYAVKTDKTTMDRMLIPYRLRCREIYQLLLPWYNRIKTLGARVLCRL